MSSAHWNVGQRLQHGANAKQCNEVNACGFHPPRSGRRSRRVAPVGVAVGDSSCTGSMMHPMMQRNPATRRPVAPSAMALAVMPETEVPARSAHQLLQAIVGAKDWRLLQDLYQRHYSSLTTAHVAAIAMQLPKTSQPAQEGSSVSEGLQAMYAELMTRLEGQLHVLPSRLLLGVATAVQVCGMQTPLSWRAAFLSAVAALVAQSGSLGTAGSQGLKISSMDAAATTAANSGLMDAEVLGLARYVCMFYSGPGSSSEALSSAALTERLTAVLRAASTVACRSNASAADDQGRVGALAEAVSGLIQGDGALARAEAYPARVMLGVLEALQSLQVAPSQQWLAACHAGLQVSARPAQLTAASVLLSRLGWEPSFAGQFASSSTLLSSSSTSSTTTSTHSTTASAKSSTAGSTITAGSSKQATQPMLFSTSSNSMALNTTSSSSSSRRAPPQSIPATSAAPFDLDRELDVPVPNSALEGMVGLLREASNSGMLSELKATVFSQLEGCDPALVLWTAEAFHQMGSPLSNKELARCVQLALDAITCTERGSELPAPSVLPLVQRCCTQGATMPPGQLEALLEYVMSQHSTLQPAQLAETVGATAVVVARSWVAHSRASTDSAAAGWEDPWLAESSAAQQSAGPVDGKLLHQVVEAVQPHLSQLHAGLCVQLAGALSALRACGVAAARPSPAWMSSFCSALQPHLCKFSAGELRHVLSLLVHTHTPLTQEFMGAAVAAAHALIPNAPPADDLADELELHQHGISMGSRSHSSSSTTTTYGQNARGASLLGEVLSVLELLVLELGCEPTAELAVDVATQLVPAITADAHVLSAAELASSLRLLAVLHCRPAPASMQRLLQALEPYLVRLTPARLAMVAWSCAELGAVPKRTFLGRYLEVAADSLEAMRPESLALVARSFAQLGVVPDASWQQAYRDAVLLKMAESDAETLSVLAQGLLHFGLRPSSSWLRAFVIESTFKMQEADAASLARYAHFMASCEVPPPLEWVNALMDRAVEVQPQAYDPPDLLPLVLRSLVKMGWAPQRDWLHETLQRISERACELQPSSIIITATSLVTLQHTCSMADSGISCTSSEDEMCMYDAEVTYAALDALLQAAAERVEEFTAMELRWLLDPLLMLHSYVLQSSTAEVLQDALAQKEVEEVQARSQQHMAADSAAPMLCHDSVAVGLNDFVSDGWLATAILA